MSSRRSTLGLRDVFATFPEQRRTLNATALAAGALPYVVVGVAAAPLGDPAAVLLAGIATGAYYGFLYVRAAGGPVWNLVLPGLVAAVLLAIPMIPPGSGPLSEWLSPIGAYATTSSVVVLWHRHLGDRLDDWATTHFPESYRGLIGVTGE